jgi:C-terminal processing protease CtpA/Prc
MIGTSRLGLMLCFAPMLQVRLAFFVSLSLAIASTVLGSERGWFGMSVKAEGAGFFLNPTLTTATIEKVEPGSPAARQALAVGDQIVEVEGHAVAGSKAKELEPLMQKAVGETLHLRLRRQNGQVYPAALIAVPKPR